MAYNYYNQSNFQQQMPNHLFPQPNGNVYTINSSNEISSIPVGMGLTVILCLAENMLYLKSIQNGNPVIWSYKLSSTDTSAAAQGENQEEQTTDRYAELEQRLSKLEKHWEAIFDERFKS